MHQGEIVRGHWQGQAQIRDPNEKADSAANLRGATVGQILRTNLQGRQGNVENKKYREITSRYSLSE